MLEGPCGTRSPESHQGVCVDLLPPAGGRVAGLRGADRGGGQVHRRGDQRPGQVCVGSSKGTGGAGKGQPTVSSHTLPYAGGMVRSRVLGVCLVTALQSGMQKFCCRCSQGRSREGRSREGRRREGRSREGRGREGRRREGRSREGWANDGGYVFWGCLVSKSCSLVLFPALCPHNAHPSPLHLLPLTPDVPPARWAPTWPTPWTTASGRKASSLL